MMNPYTSVGTRYMQTTFIQCNLNHCSVEQDLVLQYMAEENMDIALLSDTYRVDTSSMPGLLVPA